MCTLPQLPTVRTTRRQLVAGGSALAAGATLGLRAGGPRPARAQDETITWWHITTAEEQRAAMDELAAAYMADHPGVTIEITVLENEAFKTRLATAMQSGDPPDIFQSWGGGVLYQYAEAGLTRDITDALAADGWGESINQAGIGLYSYDGKTYGVPWSLGMVGMWYRKSLFEQAGITEPPATWADFLTTVQTIKDAGITPIAVGEGDKWPGHFYWVYLAIRNGGQAAFEAAYSGAGSFADAPFVKAGEDLQALVALEPFQTDFLAATFPDADTLFANGGAAMQLMGQWAVNTGSDLAEDPEAFLADLGFFAFPMVEGGAGAATDVLGGGDGFALGVNASDAAVDFVTYLTSLEVQSDWAGKGWAVPTVTGASDAIESPALEPLLATLAEADYFQLYYDQFLPPAVGGVVNDEVQGLFAGTQTPQGVADAIAASFAAESGS